MLVNNNDKAGGTKGTKLPRSKSPKPILPKIKSVADAANPKCNIRLKYGANRPPTIDQKATQRFSSHKFHADNTGLRFKTALKI